MAKCASRKVKTSLRFLRTIKELLASPYFSWSSVMCNPSSEYLPSYCGVEFLLILHVLYIVNSGNGAVIRK